MHAIQALSFLTTSLPSKPLLKPPTAQKSHLPAKRLNLHLTYSYSSDEFPVGDNDAFLESFGAKSTESEEEARRKNWIERGWAPWEEILTPEADFARKSLNEGEEVPLQTPEAIEAFKMLRPKYRKQKMKEMGLTEDEYYAKQFEIKGEIPEPLKTLWSGPLVLGLVPPRDWPPRGWEVDREELEFIRGAHKLHSAIRLDYEKLDERAEKVKDTGDMSFERYKVFLKQYNEWVEANRDRLEEESYETKIIIPAGGKGERIIKRTCMSFRKVTAIQLYQGAFVDIGGVHDGWVPIRRNDWYWIRHHIKVGMHVIVEIVAKRDPYRFRFPIELRFVEPNIDHLIFHKFDYPPIFHRDSNPDELRRDSGRPPIPRKDPGIKWEEEPLLSNHPYVDKLWQIHNAEQMILDDMGANPDKYKDKKLSELTDEEEFDEENSVEYGKAYYKKALLPRITLKTSVKELDLVAAHAERQVHIKLWKEAAERGEEYKITKLRRNEEMDEYDFIHWRRSFEEREALLRDISWYVDPSYFGKDEYDQDNPLYRYDYWGEPKNSEKSKQDRMMDAHNKSIVGK
ncbi:plastid RNA-binding protein, partial [Striga asiatica]